MMLFTYSKSIAEAMLQIFFLGAIGFILVRKKVISGEGVTGLTKLLIEVVFPALIFWQIVTKFEFRQFPRWWMISLLSMGITALGIGIGYIFGYAIKDKQEKREFMCLVGFQNSGYLPLTLLGWIVPQEQLSTMLIYLFLFLLGFNLVIWSWGVFFLSDHKAKRFSMGSLFSPPVVATLAGFICVILKIHQVMPNFILSPLGMLGNCSFPLAVIVVGASLADLYVGKSFAIGQMARLVLAKLIIMPLIGLVIIMYVRLPYLIGLLLVLQLAVPSATTLAIVARRYGQKEKLISQGVFITHIVSLATLAVFLTLFNWIVFRT
jgi:malate permease and related proteins